MGNGRSEARAWRYVWYRFVPLFQLYGGASPLASQAIIKAGERAGWICPQSGIVWPFSEPSTRRRSVAVWVYGEEDFKPANGFGICG